MYIKDFVKNQVPVRSSERRTIMAKDKVKEVVTDNQLIEVGQEVVKRGRGRPKGTGGNKRPDRSWSGNENLKPGDMGRFIRHAMASWDLPPVDISDEKQVEERILWYLNNCEVNDVKPGLVGVCNALGIDKRTLYQWGQGQYRGETHTPVIKKVYKILEEIWENNMNSGKINPVVGIFLGKNHFGYADKQDVVITPNSPLGDTKDEGEIRERYLESVVVDELPPQEIE
jgi:hypothetical protein